jgi:hypothetical protein
MRVTPNGSTTAQPRVATLTFTQLRSALNPEIALFHSLLPSLPELAQNLLFGPMVAFPKKAGLAETQIRTSQHSLSEPIVEV